MYKGLKKFPFTPANPGTLFAIYIGVKKKENAPVGE
jgi:hypothetical protein